MGKTWAACFPMKEMAPATSTEKLSSRRLAEPSIWCQLSTNCQDTTPGGRQEEEVPAFLSSLVGSLHQQCHQAAVRNANSWPCATATGSETLGHRASGCAPRPCIQAWGCVRARTMAPSIRVSIIPSGHCPVEVTFMDLLLGVCITAHLSRR